MENKESSLATEIFKFQNGVYKRIIRRIFIILIIVLIAFIVSVIDSIYIRNKLVKIISEYQYVEETKEIYDMDTENGSNYYVGRDNNGKIESN